MRKNLLVIVLALCLSLAFVIPTQNIFADFTVDDKSGSGGEYWGGEKTAGSGTATTADVIGSFDFEIDRAEVTAVGSTLNVTIFTGFVTDGIGSFGSYTTGATVGAGNGMGLGDLFLVKGSDWNPDGTGPHFATDHYDSTKHTDWTHAIKFTTFDDHWNDTTLTPNTINAELVALGGGSNDANAYLSDELLTSGTFRHGQEVMVEGATGQGGLHTKLKDGSITLDDNVEYIGPTDNDWLGTITFSVDIANTELANWNGDFALHWAMSCSNDVIEGRGTANIEIVPEPSLELLLGISLVGLVGVGVVQRIKQKTVVNS